MSSPPPSETRPRSPVIETIRRSFNRFVKGYNLRRRPDQPTPTSPSSIFLQPARSNPHIPTTSRTPDRTSPTPPQSAPPPLIKTPTPDPIPSDSDSITNEYTHPSSDHTAAPTTRLPSKHQHSQTHISRSASAAPHVSKPVPRPTSAPLASSQPSVSQLPSAPPLSLPKAGKRTLYSSPLPKSTPGPPFGQQSQGPAIQSNMNYLHNAQLAASLGLQELTKSNDFKGEEGGMTLDSFLSDITNFVQARGVPASDFGAACVRLALSRCDRDIQSVRQAISEFHSLVYERQTWDNFCGTFKRFFSADPVVSTIGFAKVLNLHLQDYDSQTVLKFMSDCKVGLTKWARSDTTAYWAQPCLDARTEDVQTRHFVISKLLSEIPPEHMDRVEAKIRTVDYNILHKVFATAMHGILPLSRSPPAAAPSFAMSSHNTQRTPPPVAPRSNPPQKSSTFNPGQPRPGQPRPPPRSSFQHQQQPQRRPAPNPNQEFRPRFPGNHTRFRNSGGHNRQPYRPPPPQYRPRFSASSDNIPIPVNPGWQIPAGVCWRCLRPGHIANGCTQTPWCPWHESTSHGFLDCAQFQTYTTAALRKLYSQSTRHDGSFLADQHPQYHMDESPLPPPPDPHATAQSEYLQFMKDHLQQ